MSGSRAAYLVARREVRERVRGRAFQVSTVLMALLVLGLVAVPTLFDDDGPSEATVAVAGADARVAASTAAARDAPFDIDVRVVERSDPAAAVADGDAAAGLAGGVLTVGGDAPDSLALLLQSAWRETRTIETLERAGLESAEIRTALDPEPLRVRAVADDDGEGEGLAFAATILLFAAIFTFGLTVAYGVVEEKSSRVIEIVLAAIRPLQLLTGKVVGIGLLGLGQVLVVGGTGLVAAALSGQVELPDATATLAATVVVFFLLGYAFYACTFAVAGAIVSRQEDLQSTTAPMSVMLMAAYFVSIGVVGDPDSTLARVSTFLPPLAPMVVPARAAQDAIALWELGVAVVAMVAGTAVVLVVAARIYRRVALRLGAPLKLTQALRLAGR